MQNIKTIEEIRTVREEISKKCDFDPKKLVEYYINRQNQKKETLKAEKVSK